VGADFKRMVRGMLRLTCAACSHRFVMQVNRKELRLGQESAPKTADSEETESYSFTR